LIVVRRDLHQTLQPMTLHDSCLRCNSDLKYALYSVRVAGFGTASHPKLAMCEGHVLKSVHKHPAQYTNQRCHHTNTCTKHVSDGQRLVQTLHSYLGAIQSTTAKTRAETTQPDEFRIDECVRRSTSVKSMPRLRTKDSVSKMCIWYSPRGNIH